MVEYFEANDIISSYKDFNETIFELTIYWVKDGCVYYYTNQAEWFQKFEDDMKKLINSYNQKFEQDTPNNYSEQLPNYIDEIASSEEYFVNYTRSARVENVIIKYLEQKGMQNVNPNYLKLSIEKIFNKKYRQIREKEFSEKIRNFRKENHSKKSIIAKLGITEGMFDNIANT